MAEKRLKIAFYSPYLTDHLGGGEKHLLDVATVCAKAGAQVHICVPQAMSDASLDQLRRQLESTFGVAVADFTWIRSPLFDAAFSWKKLNWTKQFDVLYFVTDGSLFFSVAKRNILHVQIPFTQPVSGVIQRLKLRNWQSIQTNSEFTKSVIEASWHRKVDQVVHPVVDESFFNPTHKKERVILSVGRFFKQLHSKRQDVLVSAFSLLRKRTPESEPWQLVLLGSVEDESYFQEVRASAHGLPVTFVTNATRRDVHQWFERATIYWHATGFGQDETVSPEKVEHFGISTLEAMASGAVPLALGKGGQKEILVGELEDLRWQTTDELVTKTSILLRSPEYLAKFQELATRRARDFDQSHFEKAVRQLFGWQEGT